MESNPFASPESNSPKRPTVLAIGGIDPSGGAGIIVDTAAVRAVGAHGAAVVAVSTIQSGRGFTSSTPSRAGDVAAAADAVLAAHDVRAIKTGALGDAAIVAVVARLAARPGCPPLVVDPVLASTTGGALFEAGGSVALREALVPLAAIVTPNIPEAVALGSGGISGVDDMLRAAERILELGARAVLVKGGHLEGAEVVDVYADRGGRRHFFREARLGCGEVRGTGCALAAMIAGHLALGRDVEDAVCLARSALRRAIAASYSVGDGTRLLGLDGPFFSGA